LSALLLTSATESVLAILSLEIALMDQLLLEQLVMTTTCVPPMMSVDPMEFALEPLLLALLKINAMMLVFAILKLDNAPTQTLKTANLVMTIFFAPKATNVKLVFVLALLLFALLWINVTILVFATTPLEFAQILLLLLERLVMIMTSALNMTNVKLVSVLEPTLLSVTEINVTMEVLATHQLDLATLLQSQTTHLAMTTMLALKLTFATMESVLEETTLSVLLLTNAMKLVNVTLLLDNALTLFPTMERLAMTTTFALKTMPVLTDIALEPP
jgi:hypothetical protein